MSHYLFDATALAEVLRTTPSRKFVRRLTMIPPGDRWATAMGVGDLLYAARRDRSATIMTDVLGLIASVRIAPFDVSAARVYAKLRATLEWAGEELSIADVMTAAIAKSGNFVLVTRSPDVFARVPGLHLEDWTAPEPSLGRSRPPPPRQTRPPGPRRTPAPLRQSRPPRPR